MKIVIDDKIPFVRGVFEPVAQTVYLPGGKIDPASVRDADALIIRTRTRCDASLLDGSAVRMIATATIGYDHIDINYCRRHDIRMATAAGCNARGVAQWVCAALLAMDLKPQGITLGIIGVGNVGSAVREIAENVGFHVVCCDPPRQSRGDKEAETFVSLPELLRQSDIVTTHVLLDDTTRGLVNAPFFEKAKPGLVFLNSSRGEVIDEEALKVALRSGRVSRTALDVWDNEPRIDRELLQMTSLATPHIAGYTLQGKAMGTAMSVRSVASFFNLPIPPDWYPTEAPRQHPCPGIAWAEIAERMPHYYDIKEDDAALRYAPGRFEELRGDYRFREEFF